MSKEVDRPDWPRAASFQIHVCGDPDCGPHIVSYDASDKPIAETVMSRRQAVEFIKIIQGLLYEKVADRDD